MNGFLAVSFWIALVTVVPGLVTIATVIGAIAVVDPTDLSALAPGWNQWLWASVAVTVMVLTQAVGILLEGRLINRRLLGGPVPIPREFRDSSDETVIDPYDEYKLLYFLLPRLGEHDDAHGHVERAVAQFFLSNNTLVSFAVGIVVAAGLAVRATLLVGPSIAVLGRASLLIGLLVLALVVTWRVTVARFSVLAISTWSVRGTGDAAHLTA